jgi:hypothetical protein
MSNFLGFTQEIENLADRLTNKCWRLVQDYKRNKYHSDVKLIENFLDYRKNKNKKLNVCLVYGASPDDAVEDFNTIGQYESEKNLLSFFIARCTLKTKQKLKRIVYHEFAHVIDPKINTEEIFNRMEYPGKDTVLIEMDAYCKELEMIIKPLIVNGNEKQVTDIKNWLKKPDAFLRSLKIFKPCNNFLFDCYKNAEATRKIKTRMYDFLYN